MVGLIWLLVVIAVVVAAVLWMSMRATVAEQHATASLLHDPDTPTVLYAVPEGVDPAMIRVSLEVAGFPSMLEEDARVEVIRVACAAGERERVREAVAHAPVDNDGTAELAQVYGEVHFLDEAA